MRHFKALAEAQVTITAAGRATRKFAILRFRCDNSRGEYSNNEFRTILAESGIQFEPSTPYTEHQNGVSERVIRTIMEMVRCMLHDASMLQKLWAEVASTAVYIRNRCPTSTLANNITPYEAWTC